jgi:hypothetical protein
MLGIGEGSIGIVVGKTAFQRGEMITGKVVLTLNQPKKAKGLRIALIAERETWRRDARGHRTTHTETVFSSPLRLGEEKEYPAGQSTYDFSIAVPDLPMPTGTKVDLGPLSFTIGGPPPIKWRLESSLDLPMSFDINRKLPITVG